MDTQSRRLCPLMRPCLPAQAGSDTGQTFGACHYPAGKTLKSNRLWKVSRVLLGVWFTIYLVGTAAATRYISSKLRKRPYNTYKFANLLLLWQVQISSLGF